MKIVFFEGQPGSGKSTLSREICKTLNSKNIGFRLIDEHEQDTQIFGDYWDDINVEPQEMKCSFIESWSKFLNSLGSPEIVILDHSLLNQVQFLMALNTPQADIEKYFCEVVELLKDVKVQMLFFDGDSNVVIRRVNEARKNGWGERVIELLEATPYQIKHERKGLSGMVEFFADSQVLKRKLIQSWPYPLITIDVTKGDWQKYGELVEQFVIA